MTTKQLKVKWPYKGEKLQMTLSCYEGVDVLLIPDDPGRLYAFFTC